MTVLVAGVLTFLGFLAFMAVVIYCAAWIVDRAIKWGLADDPRVKADQKILAERQEIARERQAAINAWRDWQ